MATELMEYRGICWRLFASHHQHGSIHGVDFEGRKLFVLIPAEEEDRERAADLTFDPVRYETGDWSSPWIAFTPSCGCEVRGEDSVALLVSVPPELELGEVADRLPKKA